MLLINGEQSSDTGYTTGLLEMRHNGTNVNRPDRRHVQHSTQQVKNHARTDNAPSGLNLAHRVVPSFRFRK